MVHPGVLEVDPQQQVRYGRLAALLFTAGGIGTLPAAFLLENGRGREILLLTVYALVTGAVCWFLPWRRLPGFSLDLVAIVGTLDVLLVSYLVDQSYRVLLFVVVVFAALALPTRPRVVAQVGVVFLALALPIATESDAQEQARILLLWAPCVVIVAAAVRYLRETLERRERASRAFAREAIELAIRLRPVTPGHEARDRELVDLRRAVDRLR
jgi:hypothetical protein